MGNAKGKPPGAGKSSFDLIDPNKFFAALVIKPHMKILDLACGQGNYTLALAEAMGPEGVVYGADLWEEGLAKLREEAAIRGLRQIRAILADVSSPLPLDAASIDLCLMATVLHDLVEAGTAPGALAETTRLVKPGGTLAVVEFKKMDGPPGPPRHIRLAPEEVENLLKPYGFRKRLIEEIGSYTYLMLFRKV
ncbi:MAG: methyltransferase domain-containing protein [Deltaproteobacteria bacterium]|nr:methyltransferase domain-containing protein [Deltaproteobacteria bacterium]